MNEHYKYKMGKVRNHFRLSYYEGGNILLKFKAIK